MNAIEPARVEVKPNGLPNAHKIITTLATARDRPQVNFDLSKLTFARPALLALLCAELDRRIRGDSERATARASYIGIVRPRAPNVYGYLKRMNLYGAVGARQLEDIRTDREDLFQPLCRLRTTDEIELVAGRVKDILMGAIPVEKVDSDFGEALQVSLAELFENFQKHAATEALGFACAQYYPEHEYEDGAAEHRFRPGMVELAIADTGIGIEASLREAQAHSAALDKGANPCEYATRLGVTGKPVRHSGFGLWVTKRLAERNEGTLLVISGGSYCRIKAGHVKMGRLPTEWPGTFVGLALRLDRDVKIKPIYDEIGSIESLLVKVT